MNALFAILRGSTALAAAVLRVFHVLYVVRFGVLCILDIVVVRVFHKFSFLKGR